MLYVVRHGQTAANAAGLIQGQTDPELTDLGRQQAVALAAVLPPGAPVVSSPLLRARQTAESISRAYTVDQRWIELDFGSLEGVPVSDARLTTYPAWMHDPDWAPEGGESLAACGRRVSEACDELLPQVAGGDVVVVSHVTPIKAAVAWALGVGPQISWRMFVDLGSITTVAVNPSGVPVLRTYNLQPPD